jgi:hypothetical protein
MSIDIDIGLYEIALFGKQGVFLAICVNHVLNFRQGCGRSV